MFNLEDAKLGKRQLESWLEQALVPVEPSARFLKRLRARLVTYHGGRLFSGWMVIVVLASALLLALTLVGVLLRITLAGVALIAALVRRRRRPGQESMVT
jgi:hypothetical protein